MLWNSDIFLFFIEISIWWAFEPNRRRWLKNCHFVNLPLRGLFFIICGKRGSLHDFPRVQMRLLFETEQKSHCSLEPFTITFLSSRVKLDSIGGARCYAASCIYPCNEHSRWILQKQWKPSTTYSRTSMRTPIGRFSLNVLDYYCKYLGWLFCAESGWKWYVFFSREGRVD